jgi:lipopolysaccharide transport system ATP-binding protein
MIGFPTRRDALRKHEIWALQDINFEVRRGDTLGVIGINGAGKSTLLRVICGIYPPDAGKVSIRGPIGALISAGAGFHPDMTGRENIFLNGAIIGLKKKEIDEKLEEIVEFAEIGEFIDTPVRFYSSGMYVRLGFSIAVHIRPRILLIDEVLSVGDITFQNKCFRKLKELRESVEAVLLVSHNLDHIRNICSDLIILNGGKVMYHGEVEEGLIHYQAYADELRKKSLDAELRRQLPKAPFAFDSEEVELLSVRIGGAAGNHEGEISAGDDIVVRTRFAAGRNIANPQFSVGLIDEKNTVVLWQFDHDNNVRFEALAPGLYELVALFKQPALAPGVYKLNVAIRDSGTCELLTKHYQAVTLIVRGAKLARGILSCESDWKLKRIGDIEQVTHQQPIA